MILACIFDMDGVIVDSAKYHFQAWRQLAIDLSIDFTEEDNEALKGLSRVDSLEHILNKGDLHLDNDTKVALMNRKNERYLELISAMSPDEILPGVRTFMVELKAAGIKIGLGSSSQNAIRILDAIQLTEFFDAIIDGNRVTYSKPDPEVFIIGAKEMGVQPEATVVFEDALAGIEAAHRGNFKVIGVGDPKILATAQAVIPGFANFNLALLHSTFASFNRL
jgi:beta-phosphoglucomutase